jgi:hypothetical protein
MKVESCHCPLEISPELRNFISLLDILTLYSSSVFVVCNARNTSDKLCFQYASRGFLDHYDAQLNRSNNSILYNVLMQALYHSEKPACVQVRGSISTFCVPLQHSQPGGEPARQSWICVIPPSLLNKRTEGK